MDSHNRLGGVMVALVTPFDEEGNLDQAGLERLLAHILAAGVSAVCPVGSTGEGPHLTLKQRLQVVELVQQQVAGQVPVIPAVTSTVLDEALTDLQRYAELGVASALVTPPFYYPVPQSGVEAFFTSLADHSPVSVLLYNIPHLTKIRFAPESVARLAQHPRIIGIKDSSREFEYFEELLAVTGSQPDFSVLTGTDTLLMPTLVMGGHGVIAASPNLVPNWSIDLYRAVRAGDWKRSKQLQLQLLQLVLTCRLGAFPAGWKAALELAGICRGYTARPTPPLDPAQKKDLQRALIELGVIRRD